MPDKIPSLENYPESFWDAVLRENDSAVWRIPNQMVHLIHMARLISEKTPDSRILMYCRDSLALELHRHADNVKHDEITMNSQLQCSASIHGLQDMFNSTSRNVIRSPSIVDFVFKSSPIGKYSSDLRIHPEFCLGLVKRFKCLKHVDIEDRTVEIVRAALEFDLDQIDEHVETMEDPIISIMVASRKDDSSFLELMSDEEIIEMCRKVPLLLRHVPKHIDTESISVEVVKKKASNIRYARTVTPRIALEYLKHDPRCYVDLVGILCQRDDRCCVCYEPSMCKTICHHIVCRGCQDRCQGKCPMCRSSLTRSLL